jgi:hypothetical protein
MSTDPDTLELLDLDADRQSRAAAREGRGVTLPIRMGGETIAELPSELPIDVLAPLREIDEDLALMLRSVMQASQATDAQSAAQSTNLVIDLLVSNPSLPTTLLDTARAIGVNLLGQDGYDKFWAARPTREDIAALAKGVFRFYGLTLGEVSEPSGSSESGGETSNTTSNATSESTPEGSTTTQDAPQTPETQQTPDGQRPLAS